MTWLAVLFALCSAFVTALSTSVQHQVAGSAPDSVSGTWSLLRHLLSRPWWVVGQALGLLGFTFHALALFNGPIALVQPIIITGIVFAVPVRSAISRQWPESRELGAVALTAAALVAFLLASDPSHGTGVPDGPVFLLLVVGSAVVGFAVFALARLVRRPTERAFLMGAGAGFLFGLVAVLIKATEWQLHEGGVARMVTTWPLYSVLVVGVSGVALNQVAYRSARLSASMPVLNVVNILLGLSFGYLVFQEVPRHTPIAIAIELGGLARALRGPVAARQLRGAAPRRAGGGRPRRWARGWARRVARSAHVTVAGHDVLGRGHLGQPHRSAGVQLLGADADLGAEAELAPVGEAGAGVDQHRG